MFQQYLFSFYPTATYSFGQTNVLEKLTEQLADYIGT